nr:MAG TPA: hypothetical protein [Caudoviricetes sp.]
MLLTFETFVNECLQKGNKPMFLDVCRRRR